MRIIISPAKKMNRVENFLEEVGTPVLCRQTEQLKRRLQSMEYGDLRTLWCCNDKIAEQNFLRLRDMYRTPADTPALLAYEGIQYQYMAPRVFSDAQWAYVQKHLRILSGFYGVLRPMDGVVPYRLEMQAKLSLGEAKNLYQFWGKEICRQVCTGETVIVNLASKEYSRIVQEHLPDGRRWLTCTFGELADDRVKVKGTQAKMARGEMVRWMAEQQIQDPEQLRAFSGLGYVYREEYSTADEFVFVKGPA